VHERRAGGHDDAVQVVLAYGVFNLVLARVGAGVAVADDRNDVGQRFRVLRYRRRIDGAGDVQAAVAHEYADAQFLARRDRRFLLFVGH
jgi:hypothetical protein